MDYGELVDDFNPDHDYLYLHMNTYLRQPNMTKIKNTNPFSMYACKIYSLLSNQYKYIIAFVAMDDIPIGSEVALSRLRWVNLQTRSLAENMKCNTHSYTPTYDTPLNKTIRRVHIDTKSSHYSCAALPYISIDLLHGNKKDRNSYQNEGTLIAALETYETIVALK
jgi:hypothetical protein